MDEKLNASQFPKIFYARHMQPGPARYENETILVDTDAMKAMLPTAVGKPVYIHHQPVDLKNMKEEAAGYITEAFYNELDGWAWFKILAIDDECHNAIKKGWSVSNAYRPTQFANGGTKNNVPYDREVVGGDFTHLAIVPDPRYEDATIMSPEEFKGYQESKRAHLAELQNSLRSKGPSMFKLFKTTREQVSTVDGEVEIELQNGKQVSIAEMIKTVEDAAKAVPQVVMVNGKEMPLADLVSAYENASKPKKNEKDEDEKDAKENADEDDEKDEKKNRKGKSKKNSDDEDDDGEKENAKAEGQKHFDELRNASKNATAAPPQIIDTSANQIARGKARYGRSAA